MTSEIQAYPEYSEILNTLSNADKRQETDKTAMQTISELPQCSANDTSQAATEDTSTADTQDGSSFLKINPETVDRKTVLKQLFANLSISRLQKTIKLLQEMLQLKILEEKEKERENAAKQARMLDILTMLKQKGIDLNEFKNFVSADDLVLKLKNSKYMYQDVNGVTRFWSGQGKVPAQMAEVMKRDGKHKEDYLREGTVKREDNMQDIKLS